LSGLTKIFIVLQLVCSLVLSVLIVLLVSRQEPYKAQLEQANTGRIALQATIAHLQLEVADRDATLAKAQKDLADEIAKNQRGSADLSTRLAQAEQARLTGESERARLQQQNTSLANSIETLKNLISEQNKALEDLRPRVAKLIEENAQYGRNNNDLQNQLAAAEQAIRKLQEQIAQSEAAPRNNGAAAPAGGNQVANLSANAAAINGRVTDVLQQAGRTLIEMNLGTRDGVKQNQRFAVYRNNSYIGEAQVNRVTADASVAIITTTKQGETVQRNDVIQSGQ
jgi:chromosome segregation ATPase